MTKLAVGIETDVETALGMATEGNQRAQAAIRDHEQTIPELQANLRMQEKRAAALQSEEYELKKLLENGRFPG